MSYTTVPPEDDIDRNYGARIEAHGTESRTFKWKDGSVLSLDPGTVVVPIEGEKRRLFRQLGGRAHYQVAKDPSRPFEVRTDQLSAVAVGTQFIVAIDDGDTSVVVTEGKVAVRHFGQPVSVSVTAGGKVATAEGGLLASEADVAKELNWGRAGYLSFSAVTVDHVIWEFKRRDPSYKTRITDPNVLAHEFNGRFDLGQPKLFELYVDQVIAPAVQRQQRSESPAGEVMAPVVPR